MPEKPFGVLIVHGFTSSLDCVSGIEVALKDLVEWHIAEGTDGIVAVGTTGESATLNEQEHCRVIRQVVEIVAGRVSVIAGTGANSPPRPSRSPVAPRRPEPTPACW